MLRDLVNGLEHNGRRVSFVYNAPLRRVRMLETVNDRGLQAFYCPDAGDRQEQRLAQHPVFLAYLPMTFFQLARLIHRQKIDVINCHYLDPYFIHLVIAARLLRVQRSCPCTGRTSTRTPIRLGRQTRLPADHARRPPHRGVFGGPGETDDRGLSGCAAEGHLRAQRGRSLALHGRAGHVYPSAAVLVVRVSTRPQKGCRHAASCVCAGPARPARDVACARRRRPVARGASSAGADASDRAAGRVLGRHGTRGRDALFAACTLFVLPSRAEPFGIVLLEAAYYRKGSSVPASVGVPEIIVDGCNGVLVEPDDPAGMAAQIVALVRDPESARLLGARAHETLVKRFLWKDRIHDYIAIYEGDPRAAALGLEPGLA